MAFFKKNREEELEDFDYEDEADEEPTRKIRDLAPKNKKKRKEPPKPWGKKERLTVLIILLLTAIVSGILAIFARGVSIRNFKKPNFEMREFNFNLFKGETITIGDDSVK